jgi:hypothetical protein
MNQRSEYSRREFVAASATTLLADAASAATVGAPASAPLFRDPIFDGASDPVIIWNRQEKNWWLLYTQRRANVDVPGVSWVHGCDIGVARSADNGRTWRYLGALPGLEFERGRNTFWAPEIVWHEGTYHMYCAYVPGVPTDWNERRLIIHYTSPDLWTWQCHGPVPLSSEKVIDACVERLPSGQWRMWYKDEAHSSHTWAADSSDLNHWTVAGEAIGGRGHEGPNVFPWRGAWWMIVDEWNGLGVYRSPDARTWTRQAQNILRDPGKRPDDNAMGNHADILVQGDEAWIFYFVHPGRGPGMPAPARSVAGVEPYATRRTSLQVARLTLEGAELRCPRDEAAPFELRPGIDNWSR